MLVASHFGLYFKVNVDLWLLLSVLKMSDLGLDLGFDRFMRKRRHHKSELGVGASKSGPYSENWLNMSPGSQGGSMTPCGSPTPL